MIIVDTHEPKKIKKLFVDGGAAVDALPIGDVVATGKSICIERKSMPDFVGSIKSGHLQKQLMQMQDNYQHCYLLISGKYSDLHWNHTQWTVAQHVGALASLLVRFPNIHIAMVDNDAQLVQLSFAIIEKTDDGKTIGIRDTELLKNKLTAEDINLRILSAFDGIGIKRAQKLLESERVKIAVQFLCDEIAAVKKL